MYIVNDMGQEMVNGDNVFSFAIVPADQGSFGLLAFSVGANQAGPIRTPLVVGSKDRCEQALAAIRKGIKDRQHIVDLLGLLGQRPDITVAQPRIVLPGNGGPS
jgi:hypothetical protein